MAIQHQTPEGDFINETGTRQYQIPGGAFINETIATTATKLPPSKFVMQAVNRGSTY